MSFSERASKAGKVLKTFLEDQSSRLRFAERNRASIVKMAMGGLEPKGYRVDWIHMTSNKIINLIRDEAEAFNGKYVWDTITTDDMRDALRTTLKRFER